MSRRRDLWHDVELRRSLAVALLAPALVRLSPEHLARVLEPRYVPRARRPDAPAAVERALAITRRLLRHSCYTRGVTRYYVLRRAGYDVELVFGVDPRADGPSGHCWLLVDGQIYREPTEPEAQYIRTWSIAGES